MAQFRLSEVAREDIADILAWTDQNFGESARLRYEALLVQAILDIAQDPERAGTWKRPKLSRSARSYHLSFSRKNVAKSLGHVKQPRHFLIFRLTRDKVVQIARVLHDSMELAKHLPDDFD